MIAQRVFIAMIALFVGFAGVVEKAEARRAKGLSYAALKDSDRNTIQYMLVWTGDYPGEIDGQFGEITLHAISEFQLRSGFQANGYLTRAQVERLVAAAKRAVRRVGYAQIRDKASGVLVGLPLKLVKKTGETGQGSKYSSADGALEIRTVRRGSDDVSLLRFYREQRKALKNKKKALDRDQFRGDYFVLSWLDGNNAHFVRFQDNGRELRGISIRYDIDKKPEYRALAQVMLEDFVAFNGTVRTAIVSPPEFRGFPKSAIRRRGGRRSRGGISFGSGFVISPRGHVVTNAHVVERCSRLYVGQRKPAKLVGYDKKTDLALLLAPSMRGRAYAAFSKTPVRLGEDVAAFGFPLRTILADQLNMTTGGVSSLAGLGGDPRLIQVTAPIQKGNSGGPLIDSAGRIVGVVTSKLDALGIAEKSGDLPQAVNFAVRHELVVKFARRYGVEPELSEVDAVLRRTELAERATKFTIRVSCELR